MNKYVFTAWKSRQTFQFKVVLFTKYLFEPFSYDQSTKSVFIYDHQKLAKFFEYLNIQPNIYYSFSTKVRYQ